MGTTSINIKTTIKACILYTTMEHLKFSIPIGSVASGYNHYSYQGDITWNPTFSFDTKRVSDALLWPTTFIGVLFSLKLSE